MIRGVIGAVGVVGGSTTAAASGGVDLTGIAALITAIVGAVALGWSIWQGTQRKRTIDVDTALELVELLEERRKQGPDD